MSKSKQIILPFAHAAAYSTIVIEATITPPLPGDTFGYTNDLGCKYGTVNIRSETFG